MAYRLIITMKDMDNKLLHEYGFVIGSNNKVLLKMVMDKAYKHLSEKV